MKLFIPYYRVSTAKQERSGLSLEAQQTDSHRYVEREGGTILSEYTEAESGKRNDRPELVKALAQCKETGATLVIAKLDRLSRNVIFIYTLLDSGVPFICCDMPTANEFMIGVMAVNAQWERKQIVSRILKAFEAKRARGERWGGVSGNHPVGHMDAMRKARKCAVVDPKVREVVEQRLAEGKLLKEVADILNEAGLRTYCDKPFTKVQVMRIRDRIKQVA